MEFITLKEFADSKGVTYEAIRKQVTKYEEELRGHIVKRGRLQYLDEYAQDFLSERRRLSPVVVKVEDSREAVEELEKTVESLRAQLLKAQNELLDVQKQVIRLQAEQTTMLEAKVRYEALLEDNESLRQKAEEADARRLDSERQLEESRQEADALRKEVSDQSQEIETIRQERDEAKQEASSFTRSWFGFYRKK